jgi:hypothetical protein
MSDSTRRVGTIDGSPPCIGRVLAPGCGRRLPVKGIAAWRSERLYEAGKTHQGKRFGVLSVGADVFIGPG